MRWLNCLLPIFVLTLPTILVAQEIQFNRDVRPILSDKCFACHGPDKNTREAELRLDVRDDAVRLRDDRAAVVPGKPKESELVARITSDDEFLRMPPEEGGKPLTETEIATLREWIAQGAEYQEHWSLIPPTRPELPDVKQSDRINTPVDRFLLSRLEAEGLSYSEEADKRKLVRRLSFDLTGLPPTPDQVEQFVSDTSSDAYVQLVERLLASPHYGERLAIYWLDLVRYADTLGYHGDQVRSTSPYRDYVIDAFNNNKPFDQFTIENLAGDLLPEASLEQKVASTYNRLNRASAEGGVQPKEYLAKYAADRVRTTGAVWLGSTIGCAECHDHKFDPFSTKDFYSFAAFFADIKEQGIVGGANHIAILPVPTTEQDHGLKTLSGQIEQAQADYDQKTPARAEAFKTWQTEVAKQGQLWTPLVPTSASSSGGAKLEILPEGAILAKGKNPGKDVYKLEFALPTESIGGLRLELLPHDSLPAKGPGRAGNGNLVVHKIDASLADQPIEWESAAASHSQANHKGEYVVSGHANGWAILPETGKSLQLILKAKAVYSKQESAQATLKVAIHQNHGSGHNIGHFRLYVSSTTENATLENLASVEVARLAQIPVADRKPEEQQQLWNAFREQSPLFANLRTKLQTFRDQKTALENSVVTTIATEATTPREMRVLPRGNWMDDSGEVVLPQVPHFLPQPETEKQRLNRLDLAKWMVSKENPLVARTFVNRLWMLYFGHGLARSVDDLGSQGSWPTHPELLDWLAVEFQQNGWDIKQMVRLIVLSSAYRQSSVVSDTLRQRDPYNELYARQSRWRLDAEMVRDNALAISGLLVRDVGGVSVMPYQPAGYWDQLNFPKRTYQASTGEDQYRRGLYTHWQRTFLHPSLLAFDAPAREECTARRERSNTPIQSLVLLNDPSYVEAARKYAERILKEGDESFASRLEFAYRLALGRSPTSSESELLKQLYESNRELYQKQPEEADKLLKTGLAPVSSEMDRSNLAAWTNVARVILNLHETITRY